MSEPRIEPRPPEPSPGASGTYPLAALFVAIAICAILLTIVTGSLRDNQQEAGIFLGAGAILGGCVGLAIGLYHRQWSGAGVGLIAGAITGLLCGPLAAIESRNLASIWIGLGIGSLLLLASGLVLRAATRPDPIVPYLGDWKGPSPKPPLSDNRFSDK